MSDFRKYTTQSADGTMLEVYRWNESSKQNILLVHSYTGHAQRLSKSAKIFARAGYRVTAFDLRGHGQSEGCRGNIDRWIRYTEDTLACIATIRAPFWCVAQGTGALSFLRTMQESITPRLNGVVLANPALGWIQDVSPLQKLSLRFLGRIPKLPPIAHRFRWDQLALDQDVVESYKHDPICVQKTSLRFLNQLLKAQEAALGYAQNCAYPMFLQLSENDTIASPQTSRDFFEAYAGQRALKSYTHSGHALLEDKEHPQVCEDILTWISQQ